MSSPFTEFRKEIKPLGARLETGTVTAVDTPNKLVDVSIGGTTVADIPVAGGSMPSVNDNIWLIRQGMTVIALGNAT